MLQCTVINVQHRVAMTSSDGVPFREQSCRNFHEASSEPKNSTVRPMAIEHQENPQTDVGYVGFRIIDIWMNSHQYHQCSPQFLVHSKPWANKTHSGFETANHQDAKGRHGHTEPPKKGEDQLLPIYSIIITDHRFKNQSCNQLKLEKTLNCLNLRGLS